MTENSTTPGAAWLNETHTVCGGQITLAKAGTGAPILVLPRDNGHAPANDFLDRLAANNTVYYPWYPGFHGGGDVAAWEWLANPRDLAVVQLQLLDALSLERPTVIGLGFGGWIAAEMATMRAHALGSLVLVSPMGIQPKDGFIHDQFIFSTEAYARTAFHD